MARRDRRLVLAAAALATAALALVAAATAAGPDALIALPALLLALPLAGGRYVGEERLARLVRRAPRPSRRRDTRVARRRPRRRAGPRGGLLIAVALARRGPPSRVAAAR
jgi:hypothetical protein